MLRDKRNKEMGRGSVRGETNTSQEKITGQRKRERARGYNMEWERETGKRSGAGNGNGKGKMNGWDTGKKGKGNQLPF